MHKTAWALLVLFVFSIPWEYSLDFGSPYGNIARILGLLTVAAAVLAVLQEGRFRRLGAIHLLALALFLWLSCTYFWTEARSETLAHLRGYAQEMMLLWLVWEFVDGIGELRAVLRAWLAGSWILALLTIAGFAFSGGAAAEQVRFVAIGQDPNDVARYLAFGFPIAMHLLDDGKSRVERILWLFYFPVGFAAILLTASRSGVLLVSLILCGCAIAALREHRRGVITTGILLSCTVVLIFAAAPRGTFERLESATDLKEVGDLNQRVNIWSAGWRAFETAPLAGHGSGSFVTAAQLAPEDTAHNTVISILVESGLCGLGVAMAIVAFAGWSIWKTRGRLRIALSMLMGVWALSSLTGTVWENRLTWLLFGIAAVAPRISLLCRAEKSHVSVGLKSDKDFISEAALLR